MIFYFFGMEKEAHRDKNANRTGVIFGVQPSCATLNLEHERVHQFTTNEYESDFYIAKELVKKHFYMNHTSK